MMAPMLPLLLALSCLADKDGGTRTGEPSDEPAGDGGGSTVAPVDADGDGSLSTEDCDDADPEVFPGQAERCDGLDQDCDGLVDDGVITDGAGCQDPGPPVYPEVVDTIHLTLRTATGTYDGSDDGGVSICLGPDHCLSPYLPEWNDLEPGNRDVSAHEGLGWARAELDRFTIGTTDGEDQWQPDGFQLSFDGEPVHCREVEGLEIGDASDEVLSWTDPDGLGLGCESLFEATLTHGPMVGAVGPDRATLWVRTDATRQVRFFVAEDEEGLATAEAVHTAWPLASEDFTHRVTIQGLQPGRRYVYRVEVEDQVSGPYELFTAPEEGEVGLFTLAFGSCSKDDEQPVFGSVVAWDPDVFLFIGDNHYGDTDHLSDLRQHYRWAHERPLRRDLLASTSILATWDDHDFVGNNTDGSEPGRDTALRVFEEYWANASFGLDGTPGVFTRQRWGDVELFLVDVRYHRGVDGTLLGAAQREWLIDALAESDATFKLVASGGQWGPYGSDDSWAPWEEDRYEVFGAIAERGIGGVVLLSGDIHRFELRELSPGSGGYPLPELTSSPLAYAVGASCGDDATEPDRLTCLDGTNGFIGVTVDTTLADPTLTADIIDEAGVVHESWTIPRSALD